MLSLNQFVHAIVKDVVECGLFNYIRLIVGLGIDSDVPIRSDFDSQALDSIRFSIFFYIHWI